MSQPDPWLLSVMSSLVAFPPHSTGNSAMRHRLTHLTLDDAVVPGAVAFSILSVALTALVLFAN